MKMKIAAKINRINLMVALVFLCSVFSFNATAQDKPLDAKTLSVLVADLKQVVDQNAFNAENSALVVKKWDSRKDLAGKTKTQVINLLYEDVKSIITDSGKLYQISSIFSMYKQMPDEAFSAQTQSPTVADSKPKAVEQLVNITFGLHPYVGIEEEIAKLPGTKDIKAAEEEAQKIRLEVFDDALKANKSLTSDQKAFVRNNFAHLSKMIDKIIDDTIKENFPIEQWVMEGLDKSFSAKFTLKELNDLITYFDADTGQCVLKYVRQINMAELITGNGGRLNYTPQEKAEYETFAATSLGKKFLTAYLQETIFYEESKENAVRNKNPNADGFAILETANLNRFFNQFVKENYKK